MRNMELGVEIKKLIRATIRRGYSSVRNHPWMAGFAYCLFLFYRSFPLLFSLLITASPVLVCTAAVLGILLSFGHPETKYYKEEAPTTHDDIAATVTPPGGVLGDPIDIEDNRLIAELFMNSSSKNRRKARKKRMTMRTGTWSRSKSLGIKNREKSAAGFEANQDSKLTAATANYGAKANLNGAENHVFKCCKEKDNNRVNEDAHPYGLLQELQKTVGKRRLFDNNNPPAKEEESKGGIREDDHSEESSVESESCMTPETSMDDGISPLLDELDPLLDGDQLEATPYVHLATTDIGSEQSHRSRNSSTMLESNDDVEVDEDEDEEEDDEDEDDEEEVVEAKEADNKKKKGKGDATIIWTEDDQKNLMDLGTLELERNQQLENLIARRKRRSNQLMEDVNLIDLDSSTASNNIPAPIETIRRNPFVSPSGGDSYVSSSSNTPVPGSAPPMLFVRRNPFDLPYDNGCQETFIGGFQPTSKETHLFRRHETFSTGVASKQDDGNIEMSPFFVPENNFAAAAAAAVASEATSYQSLERQSDENDTESVVSSSANDDDDTGVVAAVAGHEDEVSLFVEHGSDVGDAVDIEVVEEEEEEEEEAEQSHVGVHTDDAEITLGGDSETQLDNISSLLPPPQEENQLAETLGDQVNSSRSSSSVYSEVIEKIDAVKKDQEEEEEEQRSSSRRIDDPHNEEPSFENDLEFSFVTTDQGLLVMDDSTNNTNKKHHHQKEPLYDSSPPAGEGYLSFSSDDSSDNMQPDEAPQLKDDRPTAENESNINSNTYDPHPPTTSQEHNSNDKYLSGPGDETQQPPSSSTSSIPVNLENSPIHIKGGSFVSNEHEQDTETGSGNKFHGHMPSDEPSNLLAPGETSDEADDDMAENALHEEVNVSSNQDQAQQLSSDASAAAGSSIHNNLGQQQGEELSNTMLREEEESSTEEQIINGGGTEEGNNGDDEGRESVAVSTLTSKSPSFTSSGSSDYNTPMAGFNFRDHFSSADFEFEFGGFTHMSELQYEHYKEAFGSQVVYETMNEVVDDMREIDVDGGLLLSESDAAGDLSRRGAIVGGEVIEDDDGHSVSGSSDGNIGDVSNVQPTETVAAAADEQKRDSESKLRSRLLEQGADDLLLLPSSVTTEEASRSIKDIHSYMKRLMEDDDVPEGSESQRKSSQLEQTHQLDGEHVSDQTLDSRLAESQSSTNSKQRREAKQPILFCFHVAMRDSSAWAAIACIDSNGYLLKAWSDHFAAPNSQEGEALAALKAIQLALVDQQPTLFLGGDARDIVDGLKSSSSSSEEEEPSSNNSNLPHAVTKIIDAAKTFLLSFRCWDVFHISEPDNFIAQNLANWAYSTNHVGPIDVSSLPIHLLARELTSTQTQLNS